MEIKEEFMDSLGKIEKLEVFESMNKEDIKIIAEVSTIKKFESGKVIFDEGSFGDELFIIISGAVRISKKIKENIKRPLATLRSNGVFGEVALISEQYRSAEASALEDTELLSITREQFEKFVNTSPAGGRIILHELISILAKRLRTTTELYKQSVDWGLSISGILELNFNEFITQNTELTIELNSGQKVSGILLRADTTAGGTELILRTGNSDFVIIPYSSVCYIAFNRNLKLDSEEE
jgi:CRP-like cAMP-binding protein